MPRSSSPVARLAALGVLSIMNGASAYSRNYIHPAQWHRPGRGPQPGTHRWPARPAPASARAAGADPSPPGRLSTALPAAPASAPPVLSPSAQTSQGGSRRLGGIPPSCAGPVPARDWVHPPPARVRPVPAFLIGLKAPRAPGRDYRPARPPGTQPCRDSRPSVIMQCVGCLFTCPAACDLQPMRAIVPAAPALLFGGQYQTCCPSGHF